MNWKKFHLSAAALVLALAPAALAGTVEVSPSSQSVSLGNQAIVDIFAVGLGNGATPALTGFDLTLFFDSTILSPASVTFTSRLGDPNNLSETFNLNSYVLSGPTLVGIQLQNISLLDGTTLFALQTAGPGGFSLASITFDTIGAGTSALSFFVASSSDEAFNDLGLTGGTGSIDVTSDGPSVPEPGTYFLGGTGLLLAGIVRRYRKQ